MNEKRILIVEDSASLAKVLQDHFLEVGLQADIAVNGEDGLSKADEHRPDLILLDIVMPKLNGIDMLKKLREIEWAKYLPVMVLTNIESEREIAACMELGVHDFMIKSDWKLEDIISEVKQRLLP